MGGNVGWAGTRNQEPGTTHWALGIGHQGAGSSRGWPWCLVPGSWCLVPLVAPSTPGDLSSMQTHEITDLTIIGGGPTGLFGQFYAGMRGATSRIVDALPELGGQLTALYPEKWIFDVGGFQKVLAKDLVNQLAAQAGQFGAKSFLGEQVTGLEQENGHFVLTTPRR